MAKVCLPLRWLLLFVVAFAFAIVDCNAFIPAVFVPEFPNGLTEVDVDSSFVDQYIFHLEIRLLARLNIFELHESVTQAVP